jgi:acyl-coenzyme A thioesterase PaaI-like protein
MSQTTSVESDGPVAADPAQGEASAKKAEAFRRRMLSPFSMRLFMLAKLPLAAMAGLRLVALDRQQCQVTVPYGWRTTNPFRSTYFAALSMAAELSTGAPAMLAVESAPVSVALLIVDLRAQFVKKAIGLTTFTCSGGEALHAAVAETLATGEAVSVPIETVGLGPDGEEVARFTFTWSFKKRSRRS